jgi:hypothetical protein
VVWVRKGGMMMPVSFSETLLESFISGVLSRFTTEHLRQAVHEDVDLIEVHQYRGLSVQQQRKAKTTMGKIFEMGKNVASGRAAEELNLKSVLKWLARHRKDFFNEIKDDRDSLLWLKRQVKIIKAEFFE